MFSQKNILQQDLGKSIIAAEVSGIHKEKINGDFIDLFKDVEYKGLIMVEIKKYKNEYYMIEANPRLWGPSQLFVDANIPIFENFLIDVGFNIDLKKQPIDYEVKYFWYGGVKQIERENRSLVYHCKIDLNDTQTMNSYMKYDIYKRYDTINIYNYEVEGRLKMDIRELEKLYEDGSKHSIYQNLPDFVSKHIDYKVEINEEWRGDRTRLEYVKKFISEVEFKTLGDIGANTGYFSLSLANEYKNKKVLAYEINRNHCDLMKVIKENFNMENIEVIEEGVDLSKIKDIDYRDIYIFFNVIHHAGVDFDKDLNITTENFMVYTENF
ncbi:DUF1698 domain-containing protein [Paraclostridium sp. AKS73]|uniref:DUF1698 domain-containing protein n=1 Tax=Paraclostridium sp. AKS73 TaxID=2876116 RepID=UPI0021DF6BB4|nr:DUF1698 domain-containing protein [Paraclostridium sp. AKS73]MCU9814803.1 DUF1698 domain-containing protein [Paraclostridium sp. AKS73]